MAVSAAARFRPRSTAFDLRFFLAIVFSLSNQPLVSVLFVRPGQVTDDLSQG
jgi:DNA-binding FadR family transcriptional regulator